MAHDQSTFQQPTLASADAQALRCAQSQDAAKRLELIETIADAIPDMLFLISLDGYFLDYFAPIASPLFRAPDFFLGRHISEVMPPDVVQLHEEKVKASLQSSALTLYSYSLQTAKGERFFESRLRITRDGLRVAASVRDVTDLRATHASLQRAAQVFSCASEAIFTANLHGVLTDVNPALVDISGYQAEQLIGKPAAVLASERHDAAFFRTLFRHVRTGGKWRGEMWNRRADGTPYPCQMTISAVFADEGSAEMQGYVGVFFDTSRQKQYEQQLELLANHDALTGLPNRTQLLRALDRHIELAARGGSAFVIMFIDLDHFKEVNDSLGHAAGDTLLRATAQRLSQLLRANDLLARVGGDEFVAILTAAEVRTHATGIAEKLLQALLAPFDIAGFEIRIAASIGICSYPEGGSTAGELLRHADIAMYEAKQSGRAAWRWYEAGMTDRARRHLLILNGLRQALDRGGLRLLYQPQYDLHSGELRAMEALLRWHSADEHGLKTAELIQTAEEGGLIAQLDRWALHTACGELAKWRGRGYAPQRMIVNISGASIANTDFAAEVEHCLQRNHLPAQCLELQLREQVLHRPADSQKQTLRQLVEQGVVLSIDGFGTAYSSLLQLHAAPPVRRISIDAAFTRGITEGESTQGVIDAIMALAGSLKLEVVVQGLESEAQAHHLRQYPQLLAQGFLLSPPLEENQCTELLLQQACARH